MSEGARALATRSGCAPPRSRSTAALLVVASVLPACVAYVDYGAGGYQRAGVWLPHRDEPAYEGEVPAPPADPSSLEWRGDLGVYRVLGEPCTFYRLRQFYRLADEAWQTAEALDGPWRSCSLNALPPGLRADSALLCPEKAATSP